METDQPQTQLNPYLTFDGKCEEAIRFYQKVIGGEIVNKSTFGEGPMEVPEAQKHRIMHIHYSFDGCTLLASDSLEEGQVQAGNNVHLSIFVQEEKGAKKIMEGLSADGGKITMPFNKVFWGGSFGMLKDKFGIQWMVSCP